MLSSFPLRPLTLAETNALDGSAQIDICKPIIGLREEDPPDAIVAVYLGIGSAVHLLVYESTAQGWESLESLSTTDGNEAFDAAIDPSSNGHPSTTAPTESWCSRPPIPKPTCFSRYFPGVRSAW